MRFLYLIPILVGFLSVAADKKPKITDLSNQVDDRLRQTKQANRDEEVKEGQRLIDAKRKELNETQFRQITPSNPARSNCMDNPGACRFEGPPNDPKSIPVLPGGPRR